MTAGNTGFARRLLRRPGAIAACCWLILVAAGTLGAPLLTSQSPLSQDLTHVLVGPSARHPLGTDELGRDLLSRLLYGGRPLLLSVAEALVVFLLIGVTLGLTAGYLGGRTDRAVTWLGDLLFAVPGIIIVLVVLAVFPGNMTAAMITFGVLGSPALIRVLRSQALSVREELYVAAARVAGLSHAQILRRHVLPRLRSVVIVQSTLFCAVVVVIQAGLGYLGLGAQPPAPSWGGLISDASQVIDRDPWMLVPAGVPLVLTVVALGVLGDAVRDISVERWATSRLPSAAARRARARARVASQPVTGPDPDPSVLLSVRDLSVEIGGVPVVQSVSFDVAAGETLGVIGESGCGKSVTALAIIGLVPGGGQVSSGRILFSGTELTGSPAALDAVRGSGIGYVSQDPMVALDPSFTVASQLAEAVRRHRRCGRAAARSVALELLAQVGVPEPAAVAARYPHQLSGGLAQRAAIALALAGQPRLLIADEPTTALDVSVQDEILGLLRDLRQTMSLSVLLITHDWGVVADLCDRSIVMYAGQIVEQATVEQMYVRPLHPYTAGLLAANPHLAVRGQPLRAIPGTVPPPGSWPPGCRFAARCSLAADDCRESVPLTAADSGRLTRCIHADQLAADGIHQ
jgi:peptide/nickel transport system ATP-binding protein/peptide/nickel transport system permease protein